MNPLSNMYADWAIHRVPNVGRSAFLFETVGRSDCARRDSDTDIVTLLRRSRGKSWMVNSCFDGHEFIVHSWPKLVLWILQTVLFHLTRGTNKQLSISRAGRRPTPLRSARYAPLRCVPNATVGPVRREKVAAWAVGHNLWSAVAREGAKSQGLAKVCCKSKLWLCHLLKSSLDEIFYNIMYHHIIYMCDFFCKLEDFLSWFVRVFTKVVVSIRHVCFF
jgi:hypothetical protein